MNGRQLTLDEYIMCEGILNKVISDGFKESVNLTIEWLNTPSAREFFVKRNKMLNQFFKESGIQQQWQNIIDRRAEMGVDATKQIFDYARSVNMEEHLVEYTRTETQTLNMLCDSNYELIKNVTQDEITSIRRTLVQDFAEGTNPRQTTLKQLELQPINGMSPKARAEMIARTESARVLNTSNLTTLKRDGINYVTLIGHDDACDDCQEYIDSVIPIDEALDIGVIHPNCRCGWVAASRIDETINPANGGGMI